MFLMEKQLISIVIPALNEAENLPKLHAELQKVCVVLGGKYRFEFVFVDDGSADGSAEALEKLAREDAQTRFIVLSRNFGKEAALAAGIRHAQGDAVVLLDADLQHPPALIPMFIKKWEDGADVVVGIRENHANNSLTRKLGANIFYAVMKRIGETELVKHGTDFRLISCQVADEFNKLTEHNRITRGLINWLGFKRDVVRFTAQERVGSGSQYSSPKLIKLAISSFIAHSLFPLKFTGYLGVFITFTASLLGAFIFVEKYILDDPWNMRFSGPAILAVIIIFLVGIILSCLGLIALYIANIHAEVANRPMYVIKSKKL